MSTTSGARRPTLPVFVLPAVLAVVQPVFSTFAQENQIHERQPLDLLGYALLIGGPLALLGRRRWPVTALVLTLAITNAYLAIGYSYGPVFASAVVAFAAAVLAGRRRAPWAIACAALVTHLGLQLAVGEEVTAGYTAGVAAWLTVVLTGSEVIRVRRERSAEVARTLAEEARRRASEERLAIARELHDVLAHHISLINIQAGVALHLMDSDPGQARSALSVIKAESRDVLRELRSALDVLRGADETAPKAPTPGLDRLDELVERSRAAGLTVHTVVEGAPRPLPARVDTAAFRIVQEALTNVYRHARAVNATVLIGYGERELTVQVDDDGVGPGGSGGPGGPPKVQGTGSGLAGMRERAGALGGRLEAGPRPEGGFRVRATLPLEAVARG